jgi:hypothetical protein
MKDPIPEYQLSSRRAISDAEMHKISDEPSKVFQDLSLSIRSEENPTIYTASVYPDEMSSVPKQSDSCDPSQPNDSTRSFGDTNPSLADTIYGSQDLHTIPQDLLSPNHHSSMSTGYGNEAAGYANASSYAPTSSPYYSMGYAPAPVRSTHALDASRGMIAMNQSSTILNIYGPRGVQQKSVDSNILTTALSVTSSSESSDISLPSYFGGSINSATDYSNADSDNESISSQNPSGMLTRSSPPAPVSMMGQFNSKISSSTQKKHKCKVCGKGFPRPSSLQTHMYYHTGEKRKFNFHHIHSAFILIKRIAFACEVEGCRRQFSIISNLRRHRKVHKDEDSQDRDGDESDMDGQPPNTFTRHKNRSSVTQGHSKGSHISAEASSLTRESFGLRGLSTPHEKDEDMVSVGLMGKPVDPNYTHQDMACQTSNNWNPYPVFTNPWTNATVFPPMPSSSPFEKLQVSRPLGAGSLSSKSKEDPPVISKASTLSPTTKFDKMGELFKSESTKSSESKSFPTGTLVTSIPKPEPLDQEVSRMNLPKNSSVELEKESTVLRKERHVPVEEHVETPNAVSPETDGYQTTTESFSGESDVTGRSNSVYRELCSVTERNAGGRQELLVSSLDPMRQAVVDRVMEEFRMMFNQSWDADFRKCAGASTSPSNVQNGNGNFTSESSSALGPKKRRREDNESPDDKNGKNSRGPGGPRESAGPNSGFEGSTRFACPFRKHSTRLYTVYSHPICALSHWETISRVKYINRIVFLGLRCH